MASTGIKATARNAGRLPKDGAIGPAEMTKRAKAKASAAAAKEARLEAVVSDATKQVGAAVQQLNSAVTRIDRLLLRLGIDPDDPTGLDAVKDDLLYVHKLRMSSELIHQSGVRAIVTAVIGAIITVVGAGILTFFHSPSHQ